MRGNTHRRRLAQDVQQYRDALPGAAADQAFKPLERPGADHHPATRLQGGKSGRVSLLALLLEGAQRLQQVVADQAGVTPKRTRLLTPMVERTGAMDCPALPGRKKT